MVLLAGIYRKVNQSYFIRAEGKVKSLDDIDSSKESERNTYLCKNVADVRFGHANRFGAITGNGEGEKVLGQVMMLKELMKQVINDVKVRIAEIKNHYQTEFI
jgi:cobalt-zinc-cadmium resistance protein CzcA